jgi:transmembrane sensor
MSTSKTWSKARVAPQARAEATEWFVSFREGEVDGAAREAFYSWLRKSPENVHAYLRITALWEDSGLLKPDELFDCEALLAKARQSSNVVGLDTAAARAMAPVAPERKRPLRFAWGAAAATLILAIGGLTVWTQRLKDTYATDIGEQRTLSLQDGSSVVLNATSRVRVRISENGRHIDLLEGQAIFRVARDPTRPFIVHSGATAVRAVGTQFEVYRKAA